MDLNQRKLNKSEWDSIEVPVSQDELSILRLINDAHENVNISMNTHKSLFSFLKVEYSDKMEDYLYNKYFADRVQSIIRKYKCSYLNVQVDQNIKIKTADKIRLERNDETRLLENDIYEYVLIFHVEKIVSSLEPNANKTFSFHYYTLHKLASYTISRINRHIRHIVDTVLSRFQERIRIPEVVEDAVQIIERNETLLKYADLTLYEHQKQLLTICQNRNAKLVLYIAPTGTGKTVGGPLALSKKHRVLFVCAARHVGLALARAAISVGKKVAFAFGCASAADIRLHYFAAKVYTKNKRTGGIGKVDNSVGTDVEIMICDIKSYLPAMYYMISFNEVEQIITYWDEPTITMDYEEHDFHKIIRRNWKKNLIPNMVLSSATLPKTHELTETIANFKTRFQGSQIYSIVSHDCKKSIPLINKDGFVVLPHYLCETYDELQHLADYCERNLTLLRYFDLGEVVQFIMFVTQKDMVNSRVQFERNFERIEDVNMKTIKTYYLTLLKNLIPERWDNIRQHFLANRVARIPSNLFVDSKGNKLKKSKEVNRPNPGIYVTTCDAFTLTDGPSIFISNDVEKIAKFYLQQSNIPAIVMDDLMKKIEHNNGVNRQLAQVEKALELIREKKEEIIMNAISSSGVKGRNKSNKVIKMFNREESNDGSKRKKEGVSTEAEELKNLATEAEQLRALIKVASLNDTFIPNKVLHQNKWAEGMDVSRVFTSSIEDSVIVDIMSLDEVDDLWKVLLMMGIGVFTNHKNIKYTEIMKTLADTQRLFMIIASSDYIYGTNYQFCHGYLSKDLNLTQEKIIQALGRVGRNNIQQDYTLRFRDDLQIMKLFSNETEKPEIRNMNILFNSNRVMWDGENYVPALGEDEEDDDEEEFAVDEEEEFYDEDDEEDDEEF